jgi:hypothetical protein
MLISGFNDQPLPPERNEDVPGGIFLAIQEEWWGPDLGPMLFSEPDEWKEEYVGQLIEAKRSRLKHGAQLLPLAPAKIGLKSTNAKELEESMGTN